MAGYIGHSLACLPAGEAASFADDNLPGQPLLPRAGQSLTQDSVSPAARPQTNIDEEDVYPPTRSRAPPFGAAQRRGAAFQPEPTGRGIRGAQQSSQDEDVEQQGNRSQYQRVAGDAPPPRGTAIAPAMKGPPPRTTAGASQKPDGEAAVLRGLGQNTQASAQTAAPGATSMASQLKVLLACFVPAAAAAADAAAAAAVAAS